MKNPFPKIKQHVKDNKKTYIACGVTAVVVGGVVYFVVTKKMINKDAVQVIAPKITQVGIGNKATIEVYVEALGDPGNIIQDLTTGTIYASQGQAARELGLSAAKISKHLAGQYDNVNGHEFIKLAKASVSPL